MKIKTQDLTGAALDWAVAHAQDLTIELRGKVVLAWLKDALGEDDYLLVEYRPSRHWSQGGPIIEREKIELKYLGYDNPPYWSALKFSPSKYARKAAIGLTPLVAAMRCFVASKLGDEVDVPEELSN